MTTTLFCCWYLTLVSLAYFMQLQLIKMASAPDQAPLNLLVKLWRSVGFSVSCKLAKTWLTISSYPVHVQYRSCINNAGDNRKKNKLNWRSFVGRIVNSYGKHTHGSFSDLEYSNPGEPDVVEWYGAEIRVIANRPTGAVVLVPVDASGVRRRQRRVRAVPGELDVGGGQVTSLAAVQVRRQIVTLGHAVLVR